MTAAALWPWPIVLYGHHVGRRLDHYTSMATGDFERMLDIVQAAGDVTGLAASSGGPAFALTFDDGYADTLEFALPVLSDRGLGATLFVVPSWFGRAAEHEWAVGTRYATAAELRDAQAAGFDVASHTWSHPSLADLDAGQVQQQVELAASSLAAESLGAGLGDMLAYPYGFVPRSAPPSVRRGFSTVKAEAGCWECAPLAIRRVYLDSDNPSDWKATVDHWTDSWLRSRDHGGCPHRRST